MHARTRVAALVAITGTVASIAALPAQATCPGGWVNSDYSVPGFNNRVLDLHTWDPDGAGPAQPVIIAGGDFTASGSTSTLGVAQWTGSAWAPIGPGIPGVASSINAMTTGPTGELVLGGSFSVANGAPANRIIAWNGSAWTAFSSGMNSTVWAVARGTGALSNRLFAGGWFTNAGGIGAARIAQWTGAASPSGSWSTVGGGLPDWVWGFAPMPNGDLMIAGSFTSVPGVSGSRSIVRWNGSSYSSVGGGVTVGNEIYELFVMPNGDLIASGNFTQIGGVNASRVARWNGISWSAMGAGFPAPARDFALMSDGSLVAANVQTPSGLPSLARWTGTTWETLGTTNGTQFAVETLPNGDLLVGGQFSQAEGQPANNIAVWRLGAGQPPAILSGPTFRDPCFTAAVPGFVSINAVRASSVAWEVQDPSAPGGWRTVTNGLLSINGVLRFNVANATTTTLTLAPQGDCCPADPFIFRARVENGCGTVTSGNAEVRVYPPLAIDQEPQSVETCSYGAATFAVQGNVTAQQYEWYFRAVGIGASWAPLGDGLVAGANGDILSISGAFTNVLTVTPDSPCCVEQYEFYASVLGRCLNTVNSNAVQLVFNGLPCGPTCDSLDFNQDGDFPTPLDLEDFINANAGTFCDTCSIDLDFNNDGDFPTPLDIEAFISVSAGGACL